MAEMRRTGKCSNCRRPVEGLVFVLVSPLRPKRLKTHQGEPEPEACYQSVQGFLQQATGHRTASEAPGPPALPRSRFHGLVLHFEPSATFAGPRPGYVFRSGEHGMGYYRDGAETPASTATERRHHRHHRHHQHRRHRKHRDGAETPADAEAGRGPVAASSSASSSGARLSPFLSLPRGKSLKGVRRYSSEEFV